MKNGVACVVEKDGKFLIIKRKSGTYSETYGLVMETVETADELIKNTVYRGIKEELGIDAKKIKAFGEPYYEKEVDYWVFPYLVKINDDTIFNNNEIYEGNFVDFENIFNFELNPIAKKVLKIYETNFYKKIIVRV